MRNGDNIQSLQGCINDLISLLALPALWSESDSGQVLGVLLDVLKRLLCLDFAYARLNPSAEAAPMELCRVAERHDAADPARIGRVLQPWLDNVDAGTISTWPNPTGLGKIALVRAWPGLSRELGVIVAASKRLDFPTDMELLLFKTAVNQATIELQRVEVHAARKRTVDAEQAKNQLLAENTLLRQQLGCEDKFGDIVGQSKALQQVLFHVSQVASTKACVLIQGETGTGKELIARAVHRYSSRKEYAFVKLNCAAIPTGLLEAELFGHEKGAFTGAVGPRTGRFELAHQGTIFLDEVGEIPLELQAKLLRVLQEQEFERLGSSRTIHVDVRLIAATNRNLMQRVDEGKFRADLFYRLNVFPITVPPLRQRIEDIPPLTLYFMRQYAREYNKNITDVADKCIDALCRYHWPGNIRELSNLIERGVILSQGTTLEIPLIELKPSHEDSAEILNLKDFERNHILRALNESGWVIAGPFGAAARLGMKRTSLQYKMQQLGINRPR
jgi:transcriptional regulator with GAF, ATPase, and Fis domain